MIRSMTAFALRERAHNGGVLVCELRSVNHRYLETHLKLPDELRAIEPGLREQATASLGRGKLDGQIRLQSGSTSSSRLTIDHARLGALIDAIQEVEHVMHNAARVTALDLLQWPEVVRQPELDRDPLQTAALELFAATLTELIATREQEGQRLEALIETRCQSIMEIVQQVKDRWPEVIQRIHDKLQARINEFTTSADPGRIEQELAILAQKMDIDEELDRLDSHIQETRAALQRDEPAGRRLDFLMQECNREANTLASKSADGDTTQAAIDLKVLIEQIREQVQNAE